MAPVAPEQVDLLVVKPQRRHLAATGRKGLLVRVGRAAVDLVAECARAADSTCRT